MFNPLKILQVCAASALLNGCASFDHPQLIDKNVLPLEALTEAINCELKNAVEEQIDQNPWLKTWQGQYSITLKANHIGYARLGASTFPIVLPQSSLLNVGVAAGYTQTSNRTALLKFNISFKDLVGKPPCVPAMRPSGHPFLVGEIGFREWIARAIAASGDQSSKVNPDKLSSIGHTFEFIVDVNASVSPSFIIAPAPNILVNPTASLDRVEDNIVDVSFGKIPPAVADISTIARLLDKRQKENKKVAQNNIAMKSAFIQQANFTLSQTENKNLLQDDEKLRELRLQIQPDVVAPQEMPRIQSEQRLAMQRLMMQLETRVARNEQKIGRLKNLRQQRNNAVAQRDEYKAKIREIDANPAITRVTHSQAPIPAVALSPEANPNVTNTLLQLQLERLIGTGFERR